MPLLLGVTRGFRLEPQHRLNGAKRAAFLHQPRLWNKPASRPPPSCRPRLLNPGRAGYRHFRHEVLTAEMQIVKQFDTFSEPLVECQPRTRESVGEGVQLQSNVDLGATHRGFPDICRSAMNPVLGPTHRQKTGKNQNHCSTVILIQSAGGPGERRAKIYPIHRRRSRQILRLRVPFLRSLQARHFTQ